jgi:hypothetical protein
VIQELQTQLTKLHGERDALIAHTHKQDEDILELKSQIKQTSVKATKNTKSTHEAHILNEEVQTN